MAFVVPGPAPHRSGREGWLVPIGGALASPQIFERFIALAGGPGARIAVVPVASRLPRTGAEYADALRHHGAREAPVLGVRSRADSEHREALDVLARADAVFFTGGDQVRLAEVLGGTPVARVLRRRWAAEGIPVAGTSAGASYLSERMIARGWNGSRPRPGMVTLIAGLGLADDLVIDQHFRQRKREGRLMTAVASEPGCVGVGVDEDTAAFIAPDGEAEVVGAGGVTVVDACSTAESLASPRWREPGGRRGARQGLHSAAHFLVSSVPLRLRVFEAGERVRLRGPASDGATATAYRDYGGL